MNRSAQQTIKMTKTFDVINHLKKLGKERPELFCKTGCHIPRLDTEGKGRCLLCGLLLLTVASFYSESEKRGLGRVGYDYF